MRIYRKIVFSMTTGKLLRKECYQWFGKLALCKGGGTGATSSARHAYKLQKEQMELQKKQLAALEAKEKAIEAEKQQKLDELVKQKRKGRTATILTDWENLGEPSISKKSLYS